MTAVQKPRPGIWLLAIAFFCTYILWGTTYIAIVIGLKTLPPFIMATVRFSFAAIVLFMICASRGENLMMPGIYKNLLLGVVIITGGQGLLFWSEQYISSGYAAILVSTLPFWYVLIDKKNWGIYFNDKLILTGLILGFLGIFLLFQRNIGGTLHNSLPEILGMVAVLGACICWAAGTLYYKNNSNNSSLFLNLAWQLVGGFLSSLLISLVSGEFMGFSFASVSLNSWLATLYLAIVGSLLAFIAFNWLLTVKPAAVVGTYAYVNPVIAVLLGWVIANETITITQVAGMFIILFSAFLVNSPKYLSLLRKSADK